MADIMITINGVEMPCPSEYTWGLNDVSAGESGRTDDALMHKNRVAQKRKLELTWIGLGWQETAALMAAVNPEYISVRYPDMLSGQYEVRTFYVGDRTAPVKYWRVGADKMIEKVSFNFIER